MNSPARILIIDDSAAEARQLNDLLRREGYTVDVATNFEAGVATATGGNFDVVVTDLHLSGSSAMHLNEGLDVIRRMHIEQPQVPVILITGQPSTETTIEAMKLGAHDYIIKPIDPQIFLPMIEKAAASGLYLSNSTAAPDLPSGEEQPIIGNGPAMRAVYKQIGRIAATSATVLVRGETGTGKELAAHAIHQHSARAEKPFVIVNCPAIPPNLLVSELFGHEPGAYTDAKIRRIGQFEQASGGTIFLDEIGDMSEEAQRQLLRVLQNKTIQRLGGKETISVDVRIIAATHRDLELAIVEKEFREDLFHRINVALITLPPLRERREDIPDLIEYFLRKGAEEFGFYRPVLSREAVEFLKQLSWPGNVRELQNVVRKAILVGRGTGSEEIVRDLLSIKAASQTNHHATLAERIAELLAKAQRGELQQVQAALTAETERELYGQAIRLANGDQTKAASWLGVSRPTIREKLTRYGLHPGKDSASSQTGSAPP